MPENQKTVASAGAPQRVGFPIQIPSEENVVDTNNGGEGGEGKEKEGTQGSESNQVDLSNIGDEELVKILNQRGISVENLDTIKEKLKPELPEQTDEEKQKAAIAFEKRMSDLFVENGGTLEEFVALKNVANMPLNELSMQAIKEELKEGGFDDSEIQDIINDRYFQKSIDDLEQLPEETDDEFEIRKAKLKKKKDFGTNKLSSKGKYQQQQAQSILNNFKLSIEEFDKQQANEEKQRNEFSSKVDEAFAAIPQKLTYELGKAGDIELPPIEMEVAADDINGLRESYFKDREAINKLILTEDGTLNLKDIAKIVAENEILKKTLKVAFLKGATNENEKWQKVFPYKSPHEIGLGNGAARSNVPSKSQPASFGKPQRVQTQEA